ncbi:another transcription unit protein [Drosophila biarmipes]|uniref:another transcription unit protein n=1 Tax=Drosophila biarmipes TaxID=125945 RepID=UPI0007E82015|nr:another transcription unit protein [Drosophila biarmipes]
MVDPNAQKYRDRIANENKTGETPRYGQSSTGHKISIIRNVCIRQPFAGRPTVYSENVGNSNLATAPNAPFNKQTEASAINNPNKDARKVTYTQSYRSTYVKAIPTSLSKGKTIPEGFTGSPPKANISHSVGNPTLGLTFSGNQKADPSSSQVHESRPLLKSHEGMKDSVTAKDLPHREDKIMTTNSIPTLDSKGKLIPNRAVGNPNSRPENQEESVTECNILAAPLFGCGEVKDAQSSIEEEHRKMLGNKLTTKFSATLPADNCALGGPSQLLKMPHFIAVESKAYVAKDFKNAVTEEDLKDEQARGEFINRLKTTVRWRETDSKVKESNSCVVRWSDGSETFHVGDEVFDVIHTPVTNEQNHLYVRRESLFQPQGSIKDKMTLRPKLDSTFGQSHVQGMRNRAVNKPQSGCVKVLMNMGADPVQDHKRRVKEEMATLRLEEREKRRESSKLNRRKPPVRPMHHSTANYTDSEQASSEEGSIQSNRNVYSSLISCPATDDDSLSDGPRCSTSKRKKVLQSDSD